MESKLSIALLEVFCALSFVVCGVLLGFLGGGLVAPLLFSFDEQGLRRLLAMVTGAIFGTTAGLAAAVVAFFRLPRARRQRLATSALALAALTALFTGLAVQHFAVW